MPPKVLCVAEKPSIAKAIARALGGGAARSSPSDTPYIWNYELSYNSPVWNACQLTVTAVTGHLTDIEFLPPFDKFSSDTVQLFSAPIRTFIPAGNQKVAQNITKLSKQATHLYIWTDCDREGEHIGQEIVDQALKANRKLQVFRAHFNNTEASHLCAAAGRPQRLNTNEVEAVSARRELDLRTGYAFTRMQTRFYHAEFGGAFAGRAVQYGSCQFPTLGFVVEQYFRVQNHIPEDFWYIDAAAKTSTQSLKLNWDANRVTDHLVALAHYERALDAGNSCFLVTNVTVKPTSRFRPLPLTTVTLQKKASTYLKMGAKEVMTMAEKLYNEGFVSYPRTETDEFDPAINLKAVLEKQLSHVTPWQTYAQALHATKFRDPRRGGHNDKAHPPIHPVMGASPDALGGSNSAKWKVYEFITRSFLASCSDDAKGESTVIHLKYAAENFTVSGDRIRELNFLEVYPYQKWNAKLLPDWKSGDSVPCTSFQLKKGATTPPKLLTEGELIAKMDSTGIGTDATMADHITKIVDGKFVKKEGEFFVPTALGIALVLSYEKLGLNLSLTKPLLRRETEIAVSHVASGQKRKADVLGQLVSQYEMVFKQVMSQRNRLMAEAKLHLENSLENTDYSTTKKKSTSQTTRTRKRSAQPGRSNNRKRACANEPRTNSRTVATNTQ